MNDKMTLSVSEDTFREALNVFLNEMDVLADELENTTDKDEYKQRLKHYQDVWFDFVVEFMPDAEEDFDTYYISLVMYFENHFVFGKTKHPYNRELVYWVLLHEALVKMDEADAICTPRDIITIADMLYDEYIDDFHNPKDIDVADRKAERERKLKAIEAERHKTVITDKL